MLTGLTIVLFNSCQFVVKYSGDYSVHLADPDLLVEWDMIEQVVSLCKMRICRVILLV